MAMDAEIYMSQPENTGSARIMWDPKVSAGNVIAAVAFVITGLSAYGVFVSTNTATQVGLASISAKTEDYGKKVERIGESVVRQDESIKNLDRRVDELASQVRDMQRKP